MNTYGRSRGRNGSYTTNWQLGGRELLTPDEVRMLDNRNALLFIRGERPVMDEKFDIAKHPNFKLSADGGAAPYRHGEDKHSIAEIHVRRDNSPKTDWDPGDHDIVFLFSDELEEKIKHMEEKHNETD